MLEEFGIGLALVCATTIVQAAFMLGGVRFVEWRMALRGHVWEHLPKAILVSAFTAWMFIGMVLEALIWALFYLIHPAITTLPDLETAFYFSMVTFTSVGYGDVVLTGNWRMLASLQGANGVIVFGWTTALIFYVIQSVYKHTNISETVR
jgi:hypothetical protein